MSNLHIQDQPLGLGAAAADHDLGIGVLLLSAQHRIAVIRDAGDDARLAGAADAELARVIDIDPGAGETGAELAERAGSANTLEFVGNIKKAGKSAIFIDHNIFHVYPVVDRLYVLDRGKVAGVYARSEITMDDLIDRLYRVARSGSME